MGLKGALENFLIRKAGHEDNGHIRLLGNFGGGLDAVHLPFEQNIHGDQVGLVAVYAADGFETGFGGAANDIAQALQAGGEYGTHVGVVFHHEYPDRLFHRIASHGLRAIEIAILAH